MLQRVYCFECVSRSGPNIKPPNVKAAVTTSESGKLLVNFHVAAKTGATKRNVIASCVFPEGTDFDLGFGIWDLAGKAPSDLF